MRIISLVLADLGLDKMKAEEELQKVINSNKHINEKLNEIKTTLREIVIIDEMVEQWKKYMQTDEPNNNNNNKN